MDREKITGTLLGIALAVIVLILGLSISFGITFAFVSIILWCFDIEIGVRAVVGIWLVLFLLAVWFKGGKEKK